MENAVTKKCKVERRQNREKNEKRLIVYMLEMAAFCAILLFSIFCGHEYPNIFFCGIVILLAVVMVIEVRPSLKDAGIFVMGMILLAVAGTLVDKFVSYFFGEKHLIGFTIQFVFLAPIYFPLFNHSIKMYKKMVERLKQEFTEVKK